MDMEFLSEITPQLEEKGRVLEAAAKAGAESAAIDWTFLQESEQQLIDLMSGNPPAPGAPGSIEFSWVLYALNDLLPSSLDWLKDALRLLGMPGTKITAADWKSWWDTLNSVGVLYGDGTWVATAKFAQADPGWLLAAIDYFLLKIGVIKKAPWGNSPDQLSVSGQDQLTVAIFGDWGTGNYTDGNLSASPSQLVIQAIQALKPEIAIHLGDVYYAGTKTEEQERLLATWYTAPAGNFTMNSNHEMYDGANGYFKTALASGTFDQDDTSYFSIEFGNWMIIGLDSAYFDTSTMFMEGALTDPDQIAFLKAAGKTEKKIMILTHHTGMTSIGDDTTPLWDQVVNALGRQPDYWYWGHEHNGIVYGDLNGTVTTQCRCQGNAAIPIGNASWFESASNISFFTNKALPNPTPDQKLRVMNGFAILTFDATDDSVTEQWYYQDGSPAWNN